MSLDERRKEDDLDAAASIVLHRGVPSLDAKFKREEIETVVLTYGAKRLTTWVDTVDRVVSTNIESVDGDPKPHETTVLYLAAKEFMQRAVDDLGTEYRYKLQTKNERMKDWARGPGNDIFHWTNLNEVLSGKDTYASFETTFIPKNYGPDQEVS